MKINVKNSKGVLLSYKKGTELKLFINGKSIQVLGPDYSGILETLQTIVGNSRRGTYHLRVSGGGVRSRIEVVSKVLYHNLAKNKPLEKRYAILGTNAVRRVLPKQYGGPGARAKYQKSYR